MSFLAAQVDRSGAPSSPTELDGPLGGRAVPGGALRIWPGGNVVLGAVGSPDVGPVMDDASGVVLVGDFHLCDRRDLRRRLELSADDTSGDARLALAAYRRWGLDVPAHLTGDFAFVLWDPARHLLLAARDPLGVKGLCWVERGSRVTVATEASQLVDPRLSPEMLDRTAVADHLAADCRDEERTFFRGVRRLRPGHLLTVEGAAGPTVRRYWDIPEEMPVARRGDTDAAEELLHLLRRAVCERLPVDGAPGVLLSGGLDSSSVAALAAEGASVPPVAVHYAFGRSGRLTSCDERAHVAACRDALGLQVVEIEADDHPLVGDTPPAAPDLETPFVGWDAFLRQSLDALRGRGVRVALTGHGGDGLLQGSRLTYLDGLLHGRLGILGELVRESRETGHGVTRLAYRYLLAPLVPSAADAWVGHLVGRPRRDPVPPWVTPGLERETGLRQRLSTFDSRRRFRRRVRQRLHDNATRLGSVERAVRWQERVARPLGVDMRHPLLDHRLVPAVLRMPPEAHFRAGRTKALLRRAMVGRLPESVRTRRGKTWFTEFVTAGLVGASGWIEPLLREPLVETLGFVDGNALRSSYTRSRDDGFNGLEGLFWHALTLELWLRRHLRDESSQVDDAVELGLGWR